MPGFCLPSAALAALERAIAFIYIKCKQEHCRQLAIPTEVADDAPRATDTHTTCQPLVISSPLVVIKH